MTATSVRLGQHVVCAGRVYRVRMIHRGDRVVELVPVDGSRATMVRFRDLRPFKPATATTQLVLGDV